MNGYAFAGNGEGNRQKLVEILTSRDSQELKIIRQTFAALYNQDLHRVLSTIRNNDALAVRKLEENDTTSFLFQKVSKK